MKFFAGGWLRKWHIKRTSDRACDWLVKSADFFRIDADSGASPIPGNYVPWRVKPLFELVLFLFIMRRRSICFRQQAALNAVALEEILAFDWHDLARFDPAAGAPLATIAEFCSTCKAPPPFELDYLDTMAAAAFFDGMDRMPYREMEVLHAFALHNKHSLEEVSERLVQSFARTAFGRGQMISRYSVDDAYSLTHALFYLTDFGGVPIEDRMARDEVKRLRVHLIGLMVLMIRRGNGDVLGELLICWLMCRFQAADAEAVVVDSAILQMLSLATPQGAVPPTHALRGRFLRGEVHFAEVYHTTLVAAILFRMLAVK